MLAAQYTNNFEAQNNTQGKYTHGHPRRGEDEGPTRIDKQMTKLARNMEEAWEMLFVVVAKCARTIEA